MENYNSYRRKTKKVKIGNIYIGGDAPVAVQSMTNIPSYDFEGTLAQVRALEAAGCEIVRIAVPDKETAKIFPYLRENGVNAALTADIHFDYRLALEAVAAGADKIRINPGNIGSDDRVKAVVDACRKKNIRIRVGVNSGSLEKSILEKYGSPTAEALAESALYSVRLLERFDFDDIVVAIKSSNVRTMTEACMLVADKCDYPMHIGVTEAGSVRSGIIKTAAGYGSLFSRGIGDTVRVSLSADPTEEVKAAYDILDACGVRKKNGVELISCPTCGRTRIDLVSAVNEFEKRAAKEITRKGNIKVAIMGCIVNGPGEAREADIGVAGGNGEALLFKKGEVVRKITESDIVSVLIDEIKKTE